MKKAAVREQRQPLAKAPCGGITRVRFEGFSLSRLSRQRPCLIDMCEKSRGAAMDVKVDGRLNCWQASGHARSPSSDLWRMVRWSKFVANG